MAFKFVAFFTLLAMVSAGGIVAPITYASSPVYSKILSPSVDAVASTQQNVVRSFGGTVSSYSKAVDTPHSSVRKTDTRINNNVFTPAVAKSVTYAAPADSTGVYAPHGPAVYATHSPTVYAAPAHTQSIYAAPAIPKTVYAAPVLYAAPAVTKTIYTQQSPIVYSHAAPAVARTVTYAAATATTNFNRGASATTYTHNAPGVNGYGTSQTVHYSPTEIVSHMSFDGFGTHWGF